jgi:hypothetical protein
LVLVKAFVDESGTGGNPRVMMAAVVARAHRWHGFNAKWGKLLKKEHLDHIGYSHIVDMENGRDPFRGWDRRQTAKFVEQTAPLLKHYGDFGTTVALSIEDHKQHYLSHLTARARRESPYGVCARILIESVVCEAMEAFGYGTVVNFVFERSQHFESARCAFNDLKEHVPAIAPNLGRIELGEKTVPGLQAADAISSIGRRNEPTAEFMPVEPGTCRVPRDHGRIPIFHVFIEETRLLSACVQADQIAQEKRFRKKRGLSG